MMRISSSLLAMTLGLAGLGACSSRPADSAGSAASDSAAPPAATSTRTATAELRNASGASLGTLTLADTSGGIAVTGRLTGLPPGSHGIHIHTVGLCEGPDFTSAGGHWNPTNTEHGRDNPKGPHFGDLPNISVNGDSVATVSAVTPGGTLSGADALLDGDGAAIVVHAGPDDNHTDPAGASGPRIACGVVRAP